jgi:hypothetical protein
MARSGRRYLEKVIATLSACALLGGLAAVDGRVREFLGNAIGPNALDNLFANFGQGQQFAHFVYATISQQYTAPALFVLAAAGLTLLMLRA